MPTPKSKRRLKKLNRVWLIVALVILALLATGGYFVNKYHQSQKEVKRLSDPQVAAQDATQQLLQAVGQLTVLPQGETPTVATVADAAKLKKQPFFASAQNGDKVLIYTQAKKAILYRTSTNKIINIAPVNIGGNNSTNNNTPTTP